MLMNLHLEEGRLRSRLLFPVSRGAAAGGSIRTQSRDLDQAAWEQSDIIQIGSDTFWFPSPRAGVLIDFRHGEGALKRLLSSLRA